jgi:diaminopimelate decarboxylase
MEADFFSKISLHKMQTPCYFLDIDGISKRCNELNSIWKKYHGKTKLAYSYKTNSLKIITGKLKRNKSLAEVVSGQELNYALQDGYKADEIIFNGSVKFESELIQSIKFGVTIQVDSIFELEQIVKISTRLKIQPKIGIRLAHKINNQTSRFGIQENEFDKCVALIKKNQLNILGLHLHCGSNITDVNQYILNLEKLKHFKNKLESKKFTYINVGGGFPANSSGKKIDMKTYDFFVRKIVDFLKINQLLTSRTLLITESGRSIVEDFGYLVSKVLFQKNVNNSIKLITDTSITQMSSVRFWKHDISFVGTTRTNKNVSYDIHGFNCFESDTIGKIINSKIIPEYIVVNNCGGYDIPSNSIWTRSLPSIYVLEGENIYQLKSTTTHNNLYRENFSTKKQIVK